MNGKTQMPMEAESVLSILDRVGSASVEVFLDGGWGVDALVGEQARPHADLDVIISADDAARFCEALRPLDFAVQLDGTFMNFVLVDPQGRQVDVHAITFDDRGYGHFPLPDGKTWPFPQQAFQGTGHINGRAVRCLSAQAQVQCHAQGYEPTENDLHDMELLQQHFGVVLPLHLLR